MVSIPKTYEVQPIDPGDPSAIAPATCGTCGLTWDDGVVTSMTPAPSARCPFEAFHEDEDEDDAHHYYDPPYDLTGTVFDPTDETFGPIMAALQSGNFETAARLTAKLAETPRR